MKRWVMIVMFLIFLLVVGLFFVFVIFPSKSEVKFVVFEPDEIILVKPEIENYCLTRVESEECSNCRDLNYGFRNQNNEGDFHFYNLSGEEISILDIELKLEGNEMVILSFELDVEREQILFMDLPLECRN